MQLLQGLHSRISCSTFCLLTSIQPTMLNQVDPRPPAHTYLQLESQTNKWMRAIPEWTQNNLLLVPAKECNNASPYHTGSMHTPGLSAYPHHTGSVHTPITQAQCIPPSHRLSTYPHHTGSVHTPITQAQCILHTMNIQMLQSTHATHLHMCVFVCVTYLVLSIA